MNEKELRISRATKRKIIKRLGILAVIVLVFAGFTFWLIIYFSNSGKNLPGTLYPQTGRTHILAGTHNPNYNSNPPTSGNHWANPADWGVYDKELPDEEVIHNLEHGGIWISYKPDISEDIRKKLEGFYQKFGSHIIITPRSANDADIALAAWQRLDKFNVADYSDERVDKFIKAYRNKGPEYVP
ncbi:MAG: DUF3105 domain-containing protein [bacterium]|nr:DUF3105 domain-containing protein [bacterium]